MTPQKAGLYFAKTSKSYKWYNLIVNLVGEPPLLYIDYAIERSATRGGPQLVKMLPHIIDEWGPEIVEPEDMQP